MSINGITVVLSAWIARASGQGPMVTVNLRIEYEHYPHIGRLTFNRKPSNKDSRSYNTSPFRQSSCWESSRTSVEIPGTLQSLHDILRLMKRNSARIQYTFITCIRLE